MKNLPYCDAARGGGRYLYLVFPCIDDEYSYKIHRISALKNYYYDNKEDGEKARYLPKPILKLPRHAFPCLMGFVTIGSKIYMFGGGYSDSRDPNNAPSTRCYVYDTRDECYIDSITLGPSLNSTKCNPLVLGPVNGRYYALSYTLAEKDLEAFDPQTESWTALPPPPVDCIMLNDGVQELGVSASTSVKNKLILQTGRHGIYIFDVVSREREHVGTGTRLPFSGRAEFFNGVWYTSTDERPNPLYAHLFNEYVGFQCLCVRGLRKISRIFQEQTTNTVIPMGHRMLCVVHSGFPYLDHSYFYIDVDVYEVTVEVEGRNRRKYKDKDPHVSLLCSARYVKNGDFGYPVVCLAVHS